MSLYSILALPRGWMEIPSGGSVFTSLDASKDSSSLGLTDSQKRLYYYDGNNFLYVHNPSSRDVKVSGGSDGAYAVDSDGLAFVRYIVNRFSGHQNL